MNKSTIYFFVAILCALYSCGPSRQEIEAEKQRIADSVKRQTELETRMAIQKEIETEAQIKKNSENERRIAELKDNIEGEKNRIKALEKAIVANYKDQNAQAKYKIDILNSEERIKQMEMQIENIQK